MADTESLLVSDGHALKKLRPNVFYPGTVIAELQRFGKRVDGE